jgi:hypothetical protein
MLETHPLQNSMRPRDLYFRVGPIMLSAQDGAKALDLCAHHAQFGASEGNAKL